MNKSGELFVLLGGLLWGFSGACGEFLFSHGAISVHTLVPWRLFLAGSACLIASALGARTIGLGVFCNLRDFGVLAAFSACGIALCQYMYFWGISLSNAAIATVIQYSAPALIICASCIMERRAPTKLEILALLMIFIGVLLLATSGDFSRLAIGGFALFVCALSAFGAAAYALLPARINAKYGALAMLGWAMLLSGCVLLPKAGDLALKGANLAAFSAIVLFGTVAAFSLFMLGLARIGAAKASLISSIEPIAAAAIAWIWLGSSLDFVQLVGFCLIFFGVIVSFRS